MNFLKLFGRKREQPSATATAAPTPAACPHVILAPRWDSVADIGHEDKAVGYKCTSCNAELTLEEGAEIRRRQAQPVS